MEKELKVITKDFFVRNEEQKSCDEGSRLEKFIIFFQMTKLREQWCL
jgi:hypothetical protein